MTVPVPDLRQAGHADGRDPRRGLHEITACVIAWVDRQSFGQGLLTLFYRHTIASLLVQENAAPTTRRDLQRYFARLASQGGAYEHDDEGPDDMPAHLRAALTRIQLSIPVDDGRPLLGIWQAYSGSNIVKRRIAGRSRFSF